MKQGVIRPCMSDNKNEREQSLRNRKEAKCLQLSQLTASWEFPDHRIGKKNPDRI